MEYQPEEKIKRILDFYRLEGRLINAVPYGSGHINNTICLTYETSCGLKQYILQKINKYVFHVPEELMDNAMAITEHLRKKILEEGGDPERETVNIVSAPGGAYYFTDENGDVWRIEKFVENTMTYQVADSPALMYETGLAFGKFQKQLSDFPVKSLYETIPGFHDTRARYKKFAEIVEKDPLGRAAECRDEIRFILERKKIADFSMDSYDRGDMPVRATHNDTKINNILFDTETGKPVCVIDLDTVMPGFAMNDFGDGVRSGTCTGAEDEKDLSKVTLDLSLYDALANGFVEGTDGCLTPYEIKTLPMGGICITYEQALRFLADYLEGDPYYKTEYREHNLVRSRTQIKMVREMEDKWDRIQNGIG